VKQWQFWWCFIGTVTLHCLNFIEGMTDNLIAIFPYKKGPSGAAPSVNSLQPAQEHTIRHVFFGSL